VPLAGGHLALDFVNTVGGLHIEPPSPAEELMDTYDDFTIWCARLSVISERQASSLRAAGRRDERPRAALLERLREEERSALADAQLAPRGAGSGSGSRDRTQTLRWTFPPPHELTDPLRPIVHAAVELLTGGPLDRLKTCGNCRWLFLDHSRNHSRRWCSMDECGIQMKHARFVEQRRRRRRAATA